MRWPPSLQSRWVAGSELYANDGSAGSRVSTVYAERWGPLCDSPYEKGVGCLLLSQEASNLGETSQEGRCSNGSLRPTRVFQA